jgi:mitogen-activated protein kinase 1/3
MATDDNDHIFLVLSLSGSTDLKDFLNNKQAEKLSDEHIIFIMYNLLCSLKFIHSMEIVHRDIKPANLLLDD